MPDTETISVRDTLASIKTVWLRPGTRLGFFTHMGTQFSVTGIRTDVGGALSDSRAGTFGSPPRAPLLTVSVVAAIAAGIMIGIFTGRHPHRRSHAGARHHRQ